MSRGNKTNQWSHSQQYPNNKDLQKQQQRNQKFQEKYQTGKVGEPKRSKPDRALSEREIQRRQRLLMFFSAIQISNSFIPVVSCLLLKSPQETDQSQHTQNAGADSGKSFVPNVDEVKIPNTKGGLGESSAFHVDEFHFPSNGTGMLDTSELPKHFIPDTSSEVSSVPFGVVNVSGNNATFPDASGSLWSVFSSVGNFLQNLDRKLFTFPGAAATTTQQPLSMARRLNELVIADQTNVVLIPNDDGGFSARWKTSDDSNILGNDYGPTWEPRCPIEYLVNQGVVSTAFSGVGGLVATKIPGGNLCIWEGIYANVQPFSNIYGQTSDKDGAATTGISGGYDYQFSFDPYVGAALPAIAAVNLNSTLTRVLLNWYQIPTGNVIGEVYDVNNGTVSLYNNSSRIFTVATLAQTSSIMWDSVNNNFLSAYDSSARNGVANCYVSRWDIDGNLVKNETLISLNGTAGDKYYLYTVPRSDGYQVFYIQPKPDVIGYEIVTNIFDSNDQPLAQPTVVNQYALGNQEYALPGGEIAVVLPGDICVPIWTSYGQANNYGAGDLYSRLMNGTNPLTNEFQVNWESDEYDQWGGTVIVKANGNLVYAWQSLNQEPPIPPYTVGSGVYAMEVVPRLPDDPALDNVEIPTVCKENTQCGGFNVVGNIMADCLNVTAALPPTIASWSAPNITTLNSGSVTPSYDPATRTISWSGKPLPVNRSLAGLVVNATRDLVGDVLIEFQSVVDNGSKVFRGTKTVTFNRVYYPPILTVSPIPVDQGTPFVVTPAMFNATNPDQNVANNATYINSTIYTIGSPLHVIFINTRTGQQVLSYTGEEAIAGVIQGTPDDSGIAPSWTVTATQVSQASQILSSPTLSANVTFIPRPIVNTIGPLNVRSDTVYVFTSADLNVTTSDPNGKWKFFDINNANIVNATTDDSLQSSNGTVVFDPSAVPLGQIGLQSVGTGIPTFDAEYCIPTSQPNELCSHPTSALVNLDRIAPPITPQSNLTAIIASISAGVAAIAAGAGIWAGYRNHAKNKADAEQLAQSRVGEPLADKVRIHLELKNVDDFSGHDGNEFCRCVNFIKSNFITSNEFDVGDLAERIGNAILNIKNIISSDNIINVDILGTNIENIVKILKTAAEANTAPTMHV